MAGCQPALPTQPGPTPTVAASATAQPTTTASPTASPEALPTSTAVIEPVTYTKLCSPLEGESLDQLSRPELLKNPFDPPRPGSDGGHFGVDFAYWTRPDGTPMQGLPIHSVLEGSVAGVIHDRAPYGNTIIIETKIEEIDPIWREKLPFMAYDFAAPLTQSISVTCPDYDFTPPSRSLSLYLLYAHMNEPVQAEVGERIACGQTIGTVGTTGRSINPHLHLEARIGPAGSVFASMTHYDASASQDELRAYCLWRLSGAYAPFDPMLLLSLH